MLKIINDQFLDFITNYDNSIFHYVSTYSPKSSIKFLISQNSDNIVFSLKEIGFSENVGVVDLNLRKMFKHYFINMHTNYLSQILINKKCDKNDLNLLSQTLFGVFLTANNITRYFNPNLFTYVSQTNDLICDKTITGFLAQQYINSLTTIIDKSFYCDLIETMRATSFSKHNCNINTKMFDCINDRINSLTVKDFELVLKKNPNVDLGDLVDLYRTILNSIFDGLQEKKLNLFQKLEFWKNHNPVCIYYSPNIYLDINNVAIIELKAFYVNSSELKTIDLSKFNTLENMVETLKQKIKHKSIINDLYTYDQKKILYKFYELKNK